MADMQEVIDKASPDWTNRRRYIKFLLIFLCAMIVVSLGGSLALSYFARFGLYISTFLVIFVVCSFAVLMGIIGSYIFQASWENRDFLNMLPNLIPKNFGREDSNNNDDCDDHHGPRHIADAPTIQEQIQGSK